MDGDMLRGIDAFSALLAEVHELHKREVADLKAEIGLLRSTSAIIQQTSTCTRDAQPAPADDAGFKAPLPALDAELGPIHQHVHETASADRTSVTNQLTDGAVHVEANAPSGGPMEAKSSRPSVRWEEEVAGHRESKASALSSAIQGSAKKIQRLLTTTEHGLAAIRQKPVHSQTVDFSSWNGFTAGLVKRYEFEAFFCVVIFLNACMVSVEVQYTGSHIRTSLWNMEDVSAEAQPQYSDVLDKLSWIFGILFALEVILKMLGLRARFGLDYWNWIDLLVCVAWTASKLEGDYLPVDSQLLRLFRLARLLRLLRLVRTVQGFDHLFIMTTAIRGSFSVLVWTCILLSLVQMMTALFLTQYLQDQYFDFNIPPDSEFWEKQREVYVYFGTFTRAFFTTFEMTLANWPPACRVLAENVSEWFFVFAVFYKLSMGFAVIGVVNGVFIQETFRVASIDDRFMMRQKARAMQAHRDKMHQLFQEADKEQDACMGDGLISREEWREIVNDEQVKLWLASMELVAADAEKLFDMIDETKDGYISFEELTLGVARLRGGARSIDLQVLMHEQNQLRQFVENSILALALNRPLRSSHTEHTASPDRLAYPSGELEAVPVEYHLKVVSSSALDVRQVATLNSGFDSGEASVTIPASSPAFGNKALCSGVTSESPQTRIR